MVTLRVYDAAAINKKYENFVDRYSLYVPTPRNKVGEWGFMGIFLGFSFTDNHITRCCWDECKRGIISMNLGKKIKRETLPLNVQKWINKMEKLYNKALEEDTEDAWDNWIKA